MNIQGYTDYKIFPDGTVFSTKKIKPKVLKPYFDRLGYVRMPLTQNSKTTHHLLHRLLAIHFIPNPNNLLEVHHKNNDRSNYSIDNLEWVDRQTNMLTQNCANSIGNIMKNGNLWYYRIDIEKKHYSWSFKTLEEAECQRIIITSMLS